MEIHIHLHHHADPDQTAALKLIATAAERLADANDPSGRIAACTRRLNQAADGLAAVVAAHPDPDQTD